MDGVSLDGRWFRAVEDVEGGDVGPETMFRYAEEDGEIWAMYVGGRIRRGYLVGTRDGNTLDFRYAQLNEDGKTSTGHATSTINTLPDGRLRLEESWQWESRKGSGTSAVEEIPDDPA
jgi:hypothetical protein